MWSDFSWLFPGSIMISFFCNVIHCCSIWSRIRNEVLIEKVKIYFIPLWMFAFNVSVLNNLTKKISWLSALCQSYDSPPSVWQTINSSGLHTFPALQMRLHHIPSASTARTVIITFPFMRKTNARCVHNLKLASLYNYNYPNMRRDTHYQIIE